MANRYQQQLQQLLQRLKEYAIPLRKQVEQSPYWQQAQQRWQQMSKRERLLVMLTGILFVVVVIYQFILLPFTDAITRYNQDIIINEENLTFMQTAAPRILAAKGQVKPSEALNADMFLPTVESTLTENGMMPVVTELSLTNENQVNLQFKAVEFDGLMYWLVELRQKYGIQVKKFNAVPTELPGFVQANMQLQLSQ